MNTLRVAAVAMLLTAMTSGMACLMIESAKPRPTPTRADRSFELNAPRMMRGTIAAEGVLLGYNPVILRGWGLVVGLNGTGSRNVPPMLRAHMISEMARRGIGRASSGFDHIQPEAMLDSLDTAVVIVEGVLPPGAVGRQVRRGVALDGTKFDVRVYAEPSSGTESLEGGILYTTELRPMAPGEILPPTGSRQAAGVASARGAIFVNPFATGANARTDRPDPTVGRILNGGEATRELPLKLRLATPSHAKAETVQNAINTRFPREPGQAEPTAHGENSEVIRITVPVSWRSRPDDFVELLRHTTIRQSGAEAVANSIKRALVADPGYAHAASWRWEALGNRSLPTVKTLYDLPDEIPRLAALRAGARLGDPLVIPHLLEMAESPNAATRREAVELLEDTRFDPRVDHALRQRFSDEDIDVRLAAYEAQIRRADPLIVRHNLGGRFVLDIVESEFQMIYVTQVGQPRIAVFDPELSLKQPTLVDAWDGRLIVKSQADTDEVEVYYRPEDGRDRLIVSADPRLEEFVRFLAHTTTVEHPAPGLAFSYSDTVGTLYQIWRQRQIPGDFKAEQDRVLAAIQRQRQGVEIQVRPEFSDPEYDEFYPVADPEGPAAEATSLSDPTAILPPPSLKE
ncbi:MAG: hypothetical protein GY715_09300 [Planctomycetes bacterium]|nr:hypothetical protein [Planctomycetota bacterium]